MAFFQDSDAYDALPQALKVAIQQSVAGADARVILARFSEFGLDKTLKWLRSQDSDVMRRNCFHVAGQIVFGTYQACKVKPLRSAAI